MTHSLVELSTLMVTGGGSVNPKKYSEETFELLSIPAYDRGSPDVVAGGLIGSSKQLVQPGDVMISKIVPHIRRAWVVPPANSHRQIASGEWIVFRNAEIHGPYFRQLLISNDFNSQFMQTVAGVGGSLLRARPAHVAKIRVPLPEWTEQRRIAAILDKADDLRAKRREALAHLDALSQSIFHDMFGSLQLLRRWPTDNLGNHLDFLTSGSRGWAKHYSASGAMFLRIQNIRRNELDLADIQHVNSPMDAEAKRTSVRPGDVILSITADLGRTAVIPEGFPDAHINQHLAILRCSYFNPVFLSVYLQSQRGQAQVSGRGKGGAKLGLNFEDIRSVLVPGPPRNSQDTFATRVAAVERLKDHHRTQLAELNTLFASLQHRAFNGTL